MRTRIEQELALLRQAHRAIEYAEFNGEDWFKLPDYPLPPGWQIGDVAAATVTLLFKLGATYPTAHPYGFMIPAGANFTGTPPTNTAAAPAGPFPGSWLLFSWQPDGNWQPGAEAASGSNLLSWVRSFAQRLKEGA